MGHIATSGISVESDLSNLKGLIIHTLFSVGPTHWNYRY